MADRFEHISQLASVPTELEASLIVAALQDEGLDASMTGIYTAGFRAEAPGQVQVQVADSDLARAKSVMEDMTRDRDAIDWSQVDVGEAEDADSPDGLSSFAFWRRIAQVMIAIILGFSVLNLVRAVLDITSSIYAEVVS